MIATFVKKADADFVPEAEEDAPPHAQGVRSVPPAPVIRLRTITCKGQAPVDDDSWDARSDHHPGTRRPGSPIADALPGFEAIPSTATSAEPTACGRQRREATDRSTIAFGSGRRGGRLHGTECRHAHADREDRPRTELRGLIATRFRENEIELHTIPYDNFRLVGRKASCGLPENDRPIVLDPLLGRREDDRLSTASRIRIVDLDALVGGSPVVACEDGLIRLVGGRRTGDAADPFAAPGEARRVLGERSLVRRDRRRRPRVLLRYRPKKKPPACPGLWNCGFVSTLAATQGRQDGPLGWADDRVLSLERRCRGPPSAASRVGRMAAGVRRARPLRDLPR